MLFKKKILITGGAGYIGSETVEQLKKRYIIYNVDINNLDNKKKNIYKLDFNSPAVIEIIKKERIRDIIHLAAHTDVLWCERNDKKCLEVNYFALKSFLKNLYENNIQINNFIFASSAAVFQDNPKGLNEKSLCKPKSNYGKSKLRCENLLKKFKTKNIKKIYVLRFFNVSGGENFSKFNKNTIFHNIRKAIKKNIKFNLYGNCYNTPDGTAVRDYVHLNSIILILKKILLRKDRARYYLFNVSNLNPITNLQIINKVKKIKPNFRIKLAKPNKSEIGISFSKSKKLFYFFKIKKFNYNINHIIKDVIK